ncbi:PREDICTED: membrane-spanning 4-domains subfamily A member 3, partial [Lipotes vexillifer]|uniref:Membrane-spanning 4-domains subfamily A member 3 n=1 Tax=Lipotes vexillifer TaxID=118797 RepID=A0A340XSG1_LIPVE
AIQTLNGAIILSLGVFMCSLRNLPHPPNYIFFLIVYTGYQIWSAISVGIQISLTIADGNPILPHCQASNLRIGLGSPSFDNLESSLSANPVGPTFEMESNLGMNIANATIALFGLVFLSISLFANDPLLKDCQSSQPQDLCIYKETSSSVVEVNSVLPTSSETLDGLEPEG